MTEQTTWQASAIEHRSAWIFALCCLLLILIASLKPDLFEFSQEEVALPEQVEDTARDSDALAERIAPPVEEPAEAVKSTPEIEQPKAVVIPAKPVTSNRVITKKPAVKAVSSKTSSTPASGYYVQLGAFGEKPRAQGLVDQLKRQGWNAVISAKPNGLHAVWAGPKKDHAEAEKLQKAIEKKMKTKGFIVQQKGA
ncbi:Cell division protein DedD (protein involved in septation) [Mariprofundus aestuarium]|uniref:Cell division protein DedD (Protein involved in septation) n=1 Tax=Mariprofundus aestuarium TaxID=1921086 RepID=A0A2K8KZ01_MARES|nr:SPOR domain-containing protein [Mariprofundus aestuarium]ATX80207.1 Cell division protein DedD (protein involved in septation) [Mariprofundus aestuarium]